jgi:hypothetical protein
MYRWLPRRFSIRSLLVFVALSAFGLTAAVEWFAWNAAQERYQRALALWSVGNITASDVVGEAEVLYGVELQTRWLPQSTAKERYVERLNELADRVDTHAEFSCGGSWEEKRQQHQIAHELRVTVVHCARVNF